MKCPKCGYLGFEDVDRCRNCGYEFSLSARPSDADLALHEAGDAREGAEELSFLREASPRSAAPPTASSDLPLFGGPGIDDEPLITRAPPPRPPLAVRRATPEVPRLRPDARSQSFDLVFDPDAAPPSAPVARRHAERVSPERREEPLLDGVAVDADTDAGGDVAAPSGKDAGLGARLASMLLDLGIMFTVDVLVIYFTMAISGVGVLEFDLLPKAPLLAFLILQNLGYLVGFTAGGQTLGQMALGLRVVTAADSAPLSVGRALARTLLWGVLALPAGLGLLTAVIASDRRGLHDRLAGTRVVRASA